MKILDIILSLDPKAGGPQHTLRSITPIWRSMGHEADVLTFDPPDAPFIAPDMPKYALGEPLAKARPGRRPRLLSRIGYQPGTIGRLKQIVAGYDVVIVHGLWNFSTLASRLALVGGKVPYFVFVHGMLDPWHKVAYPMKDRVKQAIWPFNEGALMRHAQGVLFTTQAEIDLANNSYRPYRVKPLLVRYGCNGPTDDAAGQIAAFHAAFPQLRDRRFLIFISRIHPKKGCDTLLRAYAATRDALGDIDLVMAGPDQTGWREKLEAMAQDLGIADRVHWTGMISGAAKWGALRSADAFVLPSHGENFGIVVAEAMACGTPVIISDRVNLHDVVQSADAGLVSAHDLDSTIGALRAYAALPPERREAMSRNAVACYHSHYELEAAARHMIETVSESLHGLARP